MSETLVWRAIQSWRPIVLEVLRWRSYSNGLSRRQVTRLLTEETWQRLEFAIEACFTKIRVFHAGRPDDPSSYYTLGIQALDWSRATENAVDFFLPRCPELNRADINQAVEAVGPETRRGMVYVALDDRIFLKGAGHYLIYGAEYLCGVAAELERLHSRPYQHILQTRGMPTILAALIPIEYAWRSERRQLAERLCRTIATDRSSSTPTLKQLILRS